MLLVIAIALLYSVVVCRCSALNLLISRCVSELAVLNSDYIVVL